MSRSEKAAKSRSSEAREVGELTLQELLNALEECRTAFEHRCAEASEVRALEEVRVAFMGRKGQLASLRAKITTLEGEERKQFGAAVNALQKFSEQQLNTRRRDLQRVAIEAELRKERRDIDLPVSDRNENGALHPVSLMRQKLQDIFAKLGFSVLEGPDIDYEDFNFNKLNIPAHHPARDMQDTFYLAGEEQEERLLLRTHTSNVQVHAMSEHRPPLRIISMGRCFRCDFDLTHTPMFHQIEGFVVDEAISFAHLKGTIDTFLRAIYGDSLRTRFRPSYFPFVEPGAEVDIACVACAGRGGCRVCKHSGWLEVGGCGMIHPNVFEAMDIDSERYSGFAFGFGLDRMAMLYYGINDLRTLFAAPPEFNARLPIFA